MSATLDPEARSRTYGARSLYPNRVAVGDIIISRENATGGHYTHAATVRRGQYGRHHHTVTAVEVDHATRGPSVYRFTLDDGSELGRIDSAANAKLFVRTQKPEVAR